MEQKLMSTDMRFVELHNNEFFYDIMNAEYPELGWKHRISISVESIQGEEMEPDEVGSLVERIVKSANYHDRLVARLENMVEIFSLSVITGRQQETIRLSEALLAELERGV